MLFNGEMTIQNWYIFGICRNPLEQRRTQRASEDEFAQVLSVQRIDFNFLKTTKSWSCFLNRVCSLSMFLKIQELLNKCFMLGWLYCCSPEGGGSGRRGGGQTNMEHLAVIMPWVVMIFYWQNNSTQHQIREHFDLPQVELNNSGEQRNRARSARPRLEVRAKRTTSTTPDAVNGWRTFEKV